MLEFEKELFKQVETRISPSHDLVHIKKVLGNALFLQRIYGGNIKVITAAVILHDLGRSDKSLHGEVSVERSVELAVPFLQNSNFSLSEIYRVVKTIREHDKAYLTPLASLEGKILKDADFLAGVGAEGILRAILWTGESGGTREDAIKRLEVGMKRRIESLEFPESRIIAQREYRFVRLFLAHLEKGVDLEIEAYAGKYIVFEGISGSGKDTQAEILRKKFLDSGINVKIVHEPSKEAKEIFRRWSQNTADPILGLHIMIADRRKIVREELLPALRRGEIVIGVRSYMSTLVYQGDTTERQALISYLHEFVPQPDLILLFDVSEDEALRRIGRRAGEPGMFEQLERLRLMRKKYHDVTDYFGAIVSVVDAESDPEEITEIVQCALRVRKIMD